MEILEAYEKWLAKEGVNSINNYSTRLKRAIKEWDNFSGETLRPFMKTIPDIINKQNNEEYIDNIVFRLLKLTNVAWKRGDFSKGYRNDIFTAINRFGEFAKNKGLLVKNSLKHSEKEDSFNIELGNSKLSLKEEADLSKDSSFFKEFDIDELITAIVNRTRTRESAFWPARKFSSVLPEKGKWVNHFVESLIVLTECGIHKISEISSFRIQDDILYVKPSIYQENIMWQQSKAKDFAHITKDGYVKAYSYHADGSIHPFHVMYDSSGSPIPSISFEHTPAISLLVSKGNYPEIEKLIKDKEPDTEGLIKEMDSLVKQMTCVLMQRDENVQKKNAW